MILWDANRHLFVKILFSSIWMKIYTCLLVYGKRPFEKKNETDDHWCLEVKLNVCILNCKSDRDEKYWDLHRVECYRSKREGHMVYNTWLGNVLS